MTSRDRILARIRAASPGATRSPPAPLAHLVPAVAHQPHTALVARLVSELTRRSCEVKSVARRADIPAAVSEALAPGEAIAIGRDAALAGLDWDRRPVAIVTGAEPQRAMLSHALAAAAETGSLLIAWDGMNPAAPAFLCETHLVAVSADEIVGPLDDALARLRGLGPLPRAATFVSAPSRTGDIGGRIVMGAHGPRRLVVIVYGTSRD